MIAAGRVPEFMLRRTQGFIPARSSEGDFLPDEAPVRRKYLWLMIFVLPIFGQLFHYVKDVRVLWALSKAWPALSLPLCLFVLRDGPAPRGTRQILITLLYLILVPSFMGIVTFQQDFFLGVTAQVKLLPILYFFSFTGFLRLVKPRSSEISKGFLLWAFALLVIVVLMFLLVPQSWYDAATKVGDAPVFSKDSRGNRIRLPFFFGMVGIFYCLRRFYSDHNAKWLLGTLAGFGAVLGILKGRSEVLGLSVILAIGVFRFSKPATKVIMAAVLPLLGMALLAVPYVASTFDTSSRSGFDVRRWSIQKTTDFLGHDLVRWVVGNGAITPLDNFGFIRFFNHFYFLADITWWGVVFEYGLIGAFLLLLISIRALWESRTVPPTRAGAFLGSLQDYVLYTVVISPAYPLTLVPGEVAIILAIIVYEHGRYGLSDPRFRDT